MTGRLAAMSVLVPNFLPNGRSHTTASTLALARGSSAEQRQAATGNLTQHAHLSLPLLWIYREINRLISERKTPPQENIFSKHLHCAKCVVKVMILYISVKSYFHLLAFDLSATLLNHYSVINIWCRCLTHRWSLQQLNSVSQLCKLNVLIGLLQLSLINVHAQETGSLKIPKCECDMRLWWWFFSSTLCILCIYLALFRPCVPVLLLLRCFPHHTLGPLHRNLAEKRR